MTSTPGYPTLATHVDFEWWRADDARWVDRRTLSAQFTLADYNRRPSPVDDWESAEWDGQFDEFGLADPWLITSWGARYEPLRELPALFREFAAMPPDRHAYLAFAEAYGPLTARPDGGFPGRLSLWGREHQELRCAVSLYEALSSGDTDNLEVLGIVSTPTHNGPMGERRFEVSPAYAVNWDQIVESLFECGSRKCDADMVQVLRDRLSGNTEAEVSRAFLGRRLEGGAYASDKTHTSPRVLVGAGPRASVCMYGRTDTNPRTIVRRALASLLTDAFDRHGVSVVFATEESPLGLGIEQSFQIGNLIGALWVQLALAVAGNRTYRSCPVCGEWWDATNARSHKTVCSDNCRAKRSYRQRKAAQEEAAENGDSS